MNEEAQKIWLEFVDEQHDEYACYHDKKHLIHNYLARKKSQVAIDAIDFTLKYLEKKVCVTTDCFKTEGVLDGLCTTCRNARGKF